MAKPTLILTLFTLLLLACGDGESGPASGEDPTGSSSLPAPAVSGPIAAQVSAEGLTLKPWEWSTVSPNWIAGGTLQIVSDTGKPLPGATVTVLIPPSLPMSPAREYGSFPADSDGYCSLSDVPFNSWLNIAASGWGSRIEFATVLNNPNPEPVRVTLGPVGGIRGTVVGPEGEPVEGANVLVGDEVPGFLAIARTDEKERFEIAEVLAGTMTAWIMPERYGGTSGPFEVAGGEISECRIEAIRPAPVELTVLDETSGRPLEGVVVSTLRTYESMAVTNERGKVRLEGAFFPRIWLRGRGFAEASLDLGLLRQAASFETVNMRRAATARGKVTDEEGKPLAGVRVRVFSETDRNAIPVRGPLTAEDGTFEVSWIPVTDRPPENVVLAEAAGYHLVRAASFRATVARPADDLTVVLRKNQRVRLRVLDLTGAPRSGAIVGLRGIEPVRAGTRTVFNSGGTGRTDANGTIELSGMAPQVVEIEVREHGRAAYREQREIQSAEVFDLGDVLLAPGLAVAGRVRSTAGALPAGTVVEFNSDLVEETIEVGADGTFRCRGLPEGMIDLLVKAPGHDTLRVTTRAGNETLDLVVRALSGLDVKIVRPEDAPVRGWLELSLAKGSAKDKGAVRRDLVGKVSGFRFPRLVAGTYHVRVWAQDLYAVDTVVVPHGENVELTLELKAGGLIRGRLLRPDGVGAARTGVTLRAGGAWGDLAVLTGAEGQFEFRGIPPGPIEIRAHPVGYMQVSRTLTSDPAAPVEADIPLRKGGRILIGVRDAEERPAAKVRVTLLAGDGQPARYWVEGGGSAETGPDGTVVLTGLAAGEYTLSLFRGDTRLTWGKVLVSEDETARVKAVFAK